MKKVKQLYMRQKLQYGLVITDCSMPFMDGYQLATMIRSFYFLQKQVQPFIVACTGHVEDAFVKKCWSHHIDEVLSKPAKMDTICEILKECI